MIEPRTPLGEMLAGMMAEEGFTVTAANRDEQWDAPYDEAERIIRKLFPFVRAANLRPEEPEVRLRTLTPKAASMMRVSRADIRAALADLRGPVTRSESIVMACASAVVWAMEDATLETVR